MSLPTELTLNAWTGEDSPVSPVADTATKWALTGAGVAPAVILPARVADERLWADPEVGWGLILSDNDQLSQADRATGADAPAPLKRLLAARPGSPVLRYRPEPEYGIRFLRRYYTNRAPQDIATSGSQRGNAEGCLPRYLLIYGPPCAIPWELQFFLNVPGYVGRLDLEGEALARYVDALITDWAGFASRSDHPVAWAVDHGSNDITALMRRLIAEPVIAKWKSDEAIGEKAKELLGLAATAEAMVAALTESRPALIVTTSHGMTGPLDDAEKMAKQLGMPVDQNRTLMTPELLLKEWQPDGAIWYAHACCSAGADGVTRYDGLVAKDSGVDRVLKAVAGLGAQIAPLPRALLGAAKPLRAFIGHVDPTFDWTIRQPETRQPLTTSIERALYVGMYQERPETVGMAFERTFQHAGELFTQWNQCVRDLARATNAGEREAAKTAALRTQLAGLDRQSMVILGDPTACIPAL
jgi:hypothetical protein